MRGAGKDGSPRPSPGLVIMQPSTSSLQYPPSSSRSKVSFQTSSTFLSMRNGSFTNKPTKQVSFQTSINVSPIDKQYLKSPVNGRSPECLPETKCAGESISVDPPPDPVENPKRESTAVDEVVIFRVRFATTIVDRLKASIGLVNKAEHPKPMTLDALTFGLVLCPCCREAVVLIKENHIGRLNWVVSLGVCCMGGCLGCFLIPFCMNELKDVFHICPNCRTVLGVFKQLNYDHVKKENF